MTSHDSFVDKSQMRLADFILANTEPILAEWETFARAIWPGAVGTDPATLRDHAEGMLRATVSDMQSTQTAAQQSDKARGKTSNSSHSAGVDRASVAHGSGRHDSRFDLAAVIAEYRALRASVIRLWRESNPNPDLHYLADVTRFNESIDQSLTEAVLAFTDLVAREREAALDLQSRRAVELRELNDALLVSSVRQHELAEQAEEAGAAASESNERYRALFDLGPVAIYSCDASGVIGDFNRKAVELWGRKPAAGDTDERFCGSFKMFRPDGTFVPHDRCPMAEVLSGAIPSVHDGEVHIERPDGSRVVVIVTIRPLKDRHGQITGAINCFYDITERKKAEEALREAKQEAEASSHAKDKFLAVLSHELRTPLTPVLMTAAALEDRADLSPELHEDLSMIRRNVELQSRLIDDLLDLSRIISGKLRLNFDTLNVNDLVRRACDTCRSNLHERGIQLYCDFNAEGFDVVGDEGRLQQVFWNLINNATKFTPEQGQVFVRTENIAAEQMRVTVRDTGIGIAPDALESIFNAFEQAGQDESGLARKFGGMGLGLAICRALIEQHRGTIRARSDGKDKGSTFVVELPAVPRRDEAKTGSGPTKPQKLRPLRLLVVEDHPDTATVLARLLASAGHKVEIANTAADALKLAGEHQFDLVVSDLGLPDMTGYELMRQIRQGCAIKGIAMSGYGMEEDIKRSELAGFSDHLTKPVNLSQLEQAIRRVSENGMALSGIPKAGEVRNPVTTHPNGQSE
jgi:signal transduction histidine kinase/ActR/RegA family two-component response regulator